MYTLPSKSMATSPTDPVYETRIIDPDNHTLIMDLVRFYDTTPGKDNLIQRRFCLNTGLMRGLITAVIVTAQNSIVASAIGVTIKPDLYEIAKVLIDPAHKGQALYTALRQTHLGLAKGKTALLFERFADDKRDAIIQERLAEGWSLLPHDDPDFIRAEAAKGSPSSIGKVGFRFLKPL